MTCQLEGALRNPPCDPSIVDDPNELNGVDVARIGDR